jgi:hypothetical protein
MWKGVSVGEMRSVVVAVRWVVWREGEVLRDC